jgi:20S proteasome alpha/beta subunit
MTLIIALKCKEGNIIASDGRIVVLDEYRSDQKIYKISEGGLSGISRKHRRHKANCKKTIGA